MPKCFCAVGTAQRLTVDLSYHAHRQVNTTNNFQDTLDDFFKKAAKEVASAEGSSPTKLIPYNEHNTPLNMDWAVVLRWLLDHLFLVNVPSHYLITDSSRLPGESIRFLTRRPTMAGDSD